MNDLTQCPLCHAQRLEILDTYKHQWFLCLDCRNATRRRKSKYAMQYPPLRLLFSLGNTFLKALGRSYDLSFYFPQKEVINNEGKFYQLYDRACRLDYETTRWKKHDDLFLGLLKQMNIELKGKIVLSISDGPGFFAKRIEGLVSNIIITEFSQAMECDL